MNSFAALIDTFGGPARFATAIGIEPGHAGSMKFRNSVPAEYWPRVVDAGKSKGISITYEKLAKLAAAKRGEAA